MFNDLVLPTLEGAFRGYHGCVFCYGQTGYVQKLYLRISSMSN